MLTVMEGNLVYLHVVIEPLESMIVDIMKMLELSVMVNQAKVGKVHATTIRNHAKSVCFIVLTNSYSRVITTCSIFLIQSRLTDVFSLLIM